VWQPGSFNGFNVGVNGGTGMVWQVGGLINLTNTDLNVGGLFRSRRRTDDDLQRDALARRVFVGGQGGGNGTLTMAGAR